MSTKTPKEENQSPKEQPIWAVALMAWIAAGKKIGFLQATKNLLLLPVAILRVLYWFITHGTGPQKEKEEEESKKDEKQ